jgi:hypothetical protein
LAAAVYYYVARAEGATVKVELIKLYKSLFAGR